MKIAIVNYGMGNLGSVRRAFEDIGAEVFIASDPAKLDKADRIVLPGVGAFAEGMTRLNREGWTSALNDVVIAQGRPLLGICLGMHMLATMGKEGGETRGLNFVPGLVQRLDSIGCKLRIPHVGWNEVKFEQKDALFEGIPDRLDYYFVHSYAFIPEVQQDLIATTSYDCEFSSVIRHGQIYGCQFHPEKSSKAGRRLLSNFLCANPC